MKKIAYKISLLALNLFSIGVFAAASENAPISPIATSESVKPDIAENLSIDSKRVIWDCHDHSCRVSMGVRG